MRGRSWKYVVLVAALLGGASFGLPFLSVHGTDVTPYRILVGWDSPPSDPALENVRSEKQVAYDGEHEVPSRIPYYYLSTIACALAALIAIARRQLGLFTALLALGGGLCAVWGWSRELLIDRHAVDRVAIHVTWGAYLLLASGVLAVVAALGSLAVADPGKKRAHVRVVVDGEAHELEIDAPTMSVPTARVRRKRE